MFLPFHLFFHCFCCGGIVLEGCSYSPSLPRYISFVLGSGCCLWRLPWISGLVLEQTGGSAMQMVGSICAWLWLSMEVCPALCCLCLFWSPVSWPVPVLPVLMTVLQWWGWRPLSWPGQWAPGPLSVTHYLASHILLALLCVSRLPPSVLIWYSDLTDHYLFTVNTLYHCLLFTSQILTDHLIFWLYIHSSCIDYSHVDWPHITDYGIDSRGRYNLLTVWWVFDNICMASFSQAGYWRS
jgi:hypothetical protein